MDGLSRINSFPEAEAREAFLRCCGSARWADRMAAGRPYRSERELLEAARRAWAGAAREDRLEALGAHPRIGDLGSLRRKYAGTKGWAAGEQAGAAGAPESVLKALAEGNRRYEERFGRLFIVCATGKGAEELLALLEQRLENEPEAEFRIACAEQAKITELRLRKILEEA